MWHTWERREKCMKFWWETRKERDHSYDQTLIGGWAQDRDWWQAVVSVDETSVFCTLE
jgi:hypothetical protein